MSLRLQLLNLWLRHVEKPALARADPLVMRQRFERTARVLFRPPRNTWTRREEIRGVPVLRLRASSVPEGADRLLYIHGGAFVMGSSRTHAGFAARLSAWLGVEVLLPDYALAPEHPYPAGLDELERVWAATDARFLGGDSAGGHLALCLLARLCRDGGRMPDATFAFSPITDLADRPGSREDNAAADPLLPVGRLREVRALYAGTAPLDDPMISPVLGHYRGAGPVWLCVGTTEVLYDDMTAMAARLRADGVEVTTHSLDGAPHVWPFVGPWLPEAVATVNALADWFGSLPTRQAGRSDLGPAIPGAGRHRR